MIKGWLKQYYVFFFNMNEFTSRPDRPDQMFVADLD